MLLSDLWIRMYYSLKIIANPPYFKDLYPYNAAFHIFAYFLCELFYTFCESWHDSENENKCGCKKYGFKKSCIFICTQIFTAISLVFTMFPHLISRKTPYYFLVEHV